MISFLSDIEAIKMQALNRFWYDFAASRVVVKLLVRDPIYLPITKYTRRKNSDGLDEEVCQSHIYQVESESLKTFKLGQIDFNPEHSRFV